jgi:hypothetical protein
MNGDSYANWDVEPVPADEVPDGLNSKGKLNELVQRLFARPVRKEDIIYETVAQRNLLSATAILVVPSGCALPGGVRRARGGWARTKKAAAQLAAHAMFVLLQGEMVSVGHVFYDVKGKSTVNGVATQPTSLLADVEQTNPVSKLNQYVLRCLRRPLSPEDLQFFDVRIKKEWKFTVRTLGKEASGAPAKPKKIAKQLAAAAMLEELEGRSSTPHKSEKWTEDEVITFLRAIGLEIYEEAFVSNAINGEALHADLTEDNMQSDLGMKNIHAKKLVRELQKLRAS